MPTTYLSDPTKSKLDRIHERANELLQEKKFGGEIKKDDIMDKALDMYEDNVLHDEVEES